MTDPLPPSSNAWRVDWRRWMRDLGIEVRRQRLALGLSQDALAELAGVSQGAISRIETARGLAAPLVAIVRVFVALLETARRRDQALLPADVAAILDRITTTDPPPALE
jgi:predicted transcriptional regulator